MNRLAWVYSLVCIAVIVAFVTRLLPVMIEAPMGYR